MDSETHKTEPLYEFLAWLEVNKKRVITGGVTLLAVIGIVTTVVWYKNQQEFAASAALSAVRLPYNPSEAVPPGTAEKLQQVAEQYSGTAAASRAELIRAGLFYTDGKYPEAQAAFDKFLRDHPDSQWVAEAVFGIAVSLDAQKKVPEAIAKYEDFARRYPSDPSADQARLQLAGLLESSGKAAQALEQYEKITKGAGANPGGGSPYTGEAQERERLLLTKHPELAPAPAPTLNTPPAPTMVRSNPPLMLRTNLVPRPASNAPAAKSK